MQIKSNTGEETSQVMPQKYEGSEETAVPLESLEEAEKFLETSNAPSLNHEERENLKSPRTKKEIN